MSQPAAVAIEPEIISIGPLALPPQRRLSIAMLLALAALLHVATCGWGPIENGTDGMNAAIARELADGVTPAGIGQLWDQPVHSTAARWLTAQSFRLFNVSEMSARLPFGIANVLIVAMVFLIGERIGGFWRGLASGIIAATMSGAILHGRDGGGAALTALLLTIAFYGAVRMLEQRSRWPWHVLYWSAVSALFFLGHPAAAILAIISVWIPLLVFRETRIRLKLPWWLLCNGIFLALLAVHLRHHAMRFPSVGLMNSGRFFWALFPWSVVVLPPFFLRLRQILRLREMTPAECTLWCLFILGSSWTGLFSNAEEWPVNVACLGPIFALLASLIWDRTSGRIRMLGVSLLIILAISGMGLCGPVAGREWLTLLQPIWWLSSGVIILFGISALIALHHRHSRAALLTIAASTIPLAFNLLDARARYDWQHTLKDLGKKVEVRYTPGARVYMTGSLDDLSSFLFYAPQGLTIQKATPNTNISPGEYLLARSESKIPIGLEKLGSNGGYHLFVAAKR